MSMEQDGMAHGDSAGAVAGEGWLRTAGPGTRIQAIIPFRRNSAIPGESARAGRASASFRSRS